jgi:ketosteroid isomerase-like protein
MFEVSQNTMKLEKADLFALNGGSVAVSLTWKASRPGAELDTENIDVYTVENGQIVAVTVFATDLGQEDNFWGN